MTLVASERSEVPGKRGIGTVLRLEHMPTGNKGRLGPA
jgi:hypothetical protein